MNVTGSYTEDEPFYAQHVDELLFVLRDTPIDLEVVIQTINLRAYLQVLHLFATSLSQVKAVARCIQLSFWKTFTRRSEKNKNKNDKATKTTKTTYVTILLTKWPEIRGRIFQNFPGKWKDLAH